MAFFEWGVIMPKAKQKIDFRQYAQGWAAWGLGSTMFDGGLCLTLNLLNWADVVKFQHLPGWGFWLSTSVGLATLGGLPLLGKAAAVMGEAVNLNPARSLGNRQRAKEARESMLAARRRMAGLPTPPPKPKLRIDSPLGKIGREVKWNGKPVMLQIAQLANLTLKGPTSHGDNVESMFDDYDNQPLKKIDGPTPTIEPRWYVFLSQEQRTPVTVTKGEMSKTLWWGYERQNTGSIAHPWSRNDFESELGRQKDYHARIGMARSIALFEGRGQGTSGRLLFHPKPAMSRLVEAYPFFTDVYLY